MAGTIEGQWERRDRVRDRSLQCNRVGDPSPSLF